RQLVSMLSFLLLLFLKSKDESEEQKKKDTNLKVNQPSGKKPEFGKGKVKKKRKRRKKRKKNKGCGNTGKENLIPDKTNITPLNNCPDCNAELRNSLGRDTKARIVEDIVEEPSKTEVTKEICVSKWCPVCQKIVTSKTTA